VEGNGKFKGMMGALECKGKDENGRKIEASVGGGFSDKERLEIWKTYREVIIGKTIEVAADKMTLAENRKDVWALRFPRFKCIRTDK
jgi:ATP-dependent DNA ligase